ncbi:hypothetical protein EYF80_008927 [Liparis tanakae]|uniref:Uncharacterized protein n=1 Tax=Liparis tanakae TaxID=230148 RepID=A0A4Z2IUE3_9TELE|nr:hypothetical protein EYF80_008927 [Liparis tanakae]
MKRARPFPQYEALPTVRGPSHSMRPFPQYEALPTVRGPSHSVGPFPQYEALPTVWGPSHSARPFPQCGALPTVWGPALIRCQRGLATLIQVAAPSIYGAVVVSPGLPSLEQKNTAVHHIKGM